MDLREMIALLFLAAFAVVVILRLLAVPIHLTVRVVGNTLLGFGALFLLNQTTAVTGLSLGLNLWNALVIGVLGVPGFGLLLLMQWIF